MKKRKREKRIGEEVAFNRRISQKGQHGSWKLHRISKNLPAAILATFGRCHGRQALSTVVKRLESDVSFQTGVSVTIYILYVVSLQYPPRGFLCNATQYAAVLLYPNTPDPVSLRCFKLCFCLSERK